MIAGEQVAKSAPDGYTLLTCVTTTIWQNRVLYSKMPFDPDKDLSLITIFPSGGLVFAVNIDSPARSVKEWTEWARGKDTTMASYSPAAQPHMIAELFNREFGSRMVAVQYKGEGPMWPDVAGGQVNAGVGSYQAVAPFLQRERLRPLAVTGPERITKLPDVPTFMEQGLSQPAVRLLGGLPLMAPAGTPDDILARLDRAVQESVNDPKVRATHDLYGIGAKPPPMAEARARASRDAPQWIAEARALGVRLD
jgi:tripartite-type tricarboxylate transporter receptor subunit TctC